MIRPTTTADIPSLVDLTHQTEMFRPMEIQALREVLDDYFTANEAAGHFCISAQEESGLTGFAYYAPAAMTSGSWYLWWIVVRRDRQGAGIGRHLLEHLEADIRRKSGRLLFVETGSQQHYEPTRRFYLKHGYEQHAELKDFYAIGDSMIVFRKPMHP